MEAEPYSRSLIADQVCAVNSRQAQVNSSLLTQKSPLWVETDFTVAVLNGDALCGVFSGVFSAAATVFLCLQK